MLSEHIDMLSAKPTAPMTSTRYRTTRRSHAMPPSGANISDTNDMMYEPDAASAPSPAAESITRAVSWPTTPCSGITIDITAAVTGHARNAIAKLFNDSAGRARTAPATAPSAHRAMFTNPITQPNRFATPIATFHCATDRDPPNPTTALRISAASALSSPLTIQSSRFGSRNISNADMSPS